MTKIFIDNSTGTAYWHDHENNVIMASPLCIDRFEFQTCDLGNSCALDTYNSEEAKINDIRARTALNIK